MNKQTKREGVTAIRVTLLLMILSLAFQAAPVLADRAEERARADAFLADGDEKKAFRAYRELARDGDKDAQYLVSVFYAQGRGTKEDMVQAYGWSVVAAEADLEKLDQHSAALYAAVPSDRKKKADKKARSLVRKYGQEAQAIKFQRLAARGSGQRQGSCTGSRLTCRGTRSGAPSMESIPPVGSSGSN